ncbi:MAG: glycosyltransferase family 2 protein [Propionibacteriaceae bacterium]|jgi:glycosyltransferase involved in cell wall biosynthesis|nr:glycosyltransferase family 2 protein [Propionibacteriaceae bacterium]
MPRVSVIVPVYNTEEYLALTLASARRQTCDDLEIVCVDDGSTDRSADILSLTAQVEPRLKVIRQANAGSAAARNAGLRAATGDIVMFLDADDQLERTAVATVVAAFDAHPGADIVTFGGSAYPETAAYPWLEARLVPEPGVTETFDAELLFGDRARPHLWYSAFAADFLRREHVTFDERLVLGEDYVFNATAFPLSRRTVAIADRLYLYRVARRESLMAERFTDTANRLEEHLAIAETILTLWRERGWLEPNTAVLLRWLFVFFLSDTLSQPAEERGPALAGLARLLREFFPGPGDAVGPADLQLLKVLKHEPRHDGGRRLMLEVTRYYMARHGLASGLARSVRGAAASAPARRLRDLARRVLPPPAATLGHHLASLGDQVDDTARRAAALDLLRAEVAAKTGERAA